MVPPAILRGTSETVERIGILSEHLDTEAVLLWRLARDVELWGSTPPECRTLLFTAAAAERRADLLGAVTLPEDVHHHLGSICASLSRGSAAPAGEGEVSESCAAVAHWAREIEARETAIAFAQAAATASPEVGRYALLTALCCESADQRMRAWTWHERAAGLARRGKDGPTNARALLGLARIAHAEGRAARARALYSRAIRSSRRHGVLEVRAAATYGLFTLARDVGDTRAADRWAPDATRYLFKFRPHASEVALMLSGFWLDGGHPKRAAAVLGRLRAIRAFSPDTEIQAALLHTRALEATRDRRAAQAAWAEAWRLSEAPDARITVPLLVEFARTAVELRDMDGLARAGRAALVRADAAEYAAVHAELRALAAGRVDFGPPLRGAA